MKNSLTTNDKTSGYDVPIHAASGGSDLRNLMSHLWHMVDFPRFNDSVSLEPKIEVAENKSNVTVTAEIPGVAEKDIDLQISSDGYLTISAEKKDENSSQTTIFPRFHTVWSNGRSRCHGIWIITRQTRNIMTGCCGLFFRNQTLSSRK